MVVSEDGVSPRKNIILVVVVSAATFVLDVFTPYGWADWLFYLIPLLLVSPLVKPRTLIVVAATYTPLMILGLVLSPAGEVSLEMAAFNRGCGLLVLWVATLLLVHRKRAEAEHAHLAAIVDSSDDAIITKTPDGIITSWNRAAERLYGYAAPEVLGRPISVLVPPEQLNEIPQFLEHLRRGEHVDHCETVRMRKDGTCIPICLTISPIRDSFRTVVGASVMAHDISDRQRIEHALRESEHMYRFLLENLRQQIFLKDRQSVYVSCNENYARDLGIAARAITGTTDHDFYPRELAERYRADDRRVMETGVTEDLDEPYIQNGKHSWIHTVKVPVRNEAGECSGVLGIFWDITERKRAEEQLLLHSTALVSAANAIVITDTDGQIVWVNPAFTQLTGYASEEVTGRTPRLLKSGRHDRALYEQLWGAIRSGQAWSGELINRRKDGTLYTEELTITPVRQHGVITHFIGIQQDITERKRVEASLRQSETRFRSLFENMVEGFAYCRMLFEDGCPQDFIYLEVNEAFQTLTGLKNVAGRKVSDVIPGIRESDPELFERYGRVALGGRPERFETYVAALKQWFFISVYCPEKECFVAEFDVISERKQAEEQLRLSAQRLSLATESAQIGIWALDVEKNVLIWDDRMYELYGLHPEDFSGAYEAWQIGVHPDDLVAAHAEVQDAIAGRKNLHTEFRVVWPDGQVHYLEAHATVQGGPDGTPRHMIGVNWDITERKRVEAALRESAARREAIVDSAMDGIVTVDNQERILVFNSSAERIFGCPAAEAIGQPLERFIPERFGQMSNTHRVLHQPASIYGRRTSGEEFPIEASISRTEVDGHLLLTIILRDVTSQRRATEARAEEARVTAAMSQVGQMLMTELDSPDLMTALCRVTVDVLRCDVSRTLFQEEQGNEQVLRIIAGFGDSPEEQQSAQVLTLPRSVLQAMLPRLDQDDVVEVRSIPGDVLVMWLPRASSYLCMALRHGRELIGIQVAYRRKDGGSFGTAELRIAHGLAQLASLALSHVQLRKDLERANHLKADFVATMSHELRTPLNIIIGYTDLVLDGAFGSLSLEVTDTLQRVARSAHDLLNLIEATLDLARLDKEQVPLNPQPMRLADVLDELAGGLAPKPGVDLVCDVAPDLSLRTDPVKLKVILRNLIGNAFKFTERGTVTAVARARQGGVEITISDTGVGIAPQVLSIIFEPFRQGDSAGTRRFGGVGLGLYIVRRLLGILAGTINVESEMGRGSTFRVWFPELP